MKKEFMVILGHDKKYTNDQLINKEVFRMTVQELINILKEEEPDAQIYIAESEYNWDDVLTVDSKPKREINLSQ